MQRAMFRNKVYGHIPAIKCIAYTPECEHTYLVHIAVPLDHDIMS